MPNQYWWDREFRYEWDILYLKCTKCWEWKILDKFPNSKVHKFWVRPDCKECYKKNRHEKREKCNDYSKKYYLKHRDEIRWKVKDRAVNHSEEMWFNRNTFHKKARLYATRHRLKPSKCPICWRIETIEMHHPSYDNKNEWSKVVFCCKFCHRNIHLWLLECPNAIDLLECTQP
jgi:hypothetical protein